MKSDTPAQLRKLLDAQQAQLDRTIRTLGLKPTAKLLDEARRRLRGDIQDVVRRGGSDTFTAANKRAMLQQLELGIAELAKKMRNTIGVAGNAAMVESVKHLQAEIDVYAKRWNRAPAPVSGLHTAAHFADRKTALRNLTVIDPDTTKAVQRQNARSVARYGEDLITAFEHELAIGKITGASVDDMTDRLLGVGDSVFNGERYRAERIVRTELMHAYGTARQDAMENIAGEIPEMRRMWVSVLEAGRTCERCERLHGMIKGIDEPFSSGGKPVAHPPLHPHCMCVVVPMLPEDNVPGFWKPRE